MSQYSKLSEGFRTAAGVAGSAAAALSAIAVNDGYVLATQAYDQARLLVAVGLTRKAH